MNIGSTFFPFFSSLDFSNAGGFFALEFGFLRLLLAIGSDRTGLFGRIDWAFAPRESDAHDLRGMRVCRVAQEGPARPAKLERPAGCGSLGAEGAAESDVCEGELGLVGTT